MSKYNLTKRLLQKSRSIIGTHSGVGTCYPLGEAVEEVDVSWWVRVVVALAQVLYLIKLYRGTVSCRPL